MTVLPADTHVHSEWSWDTGGPDSAAAGTMIATCERAVRIGLPTVVFTEHLDLETRWRVEPADFDPAPRRFIDASGHLHPPRFDLDGYLESIDRCRHRFADLHVMSGFEFGEPHRHEHAAAAMVDLDTVDRVNGSLHTLAFADDYAEPNLLYRHRPADEVMWAYLEEIPHMVAGSDCFAVVTHLDYAAREWPSDTEGPFDPTRFEEGFRAALRAIASSGRALEMNTSRLWSWLPQWWSEEGGRAISFGSDAHQALFLATHFPEAMVMAEHFGFRNGRRPEDFWTR